jgi:hypothetical protein
MTNATTNTDDYIAALTPAIAVGTGGGCTAIAVNRPEWSRWGFEILVTDNDLNYPGHDSGPVGDGTAISYGITEGAWFAEPTADAAPLVYLWEGIYDGESMDGDEWPPAAAVAAAVVAYGDRVAAECAAATNGDPSRLTPAIAADAAARAVVNPID